MENYILSTVVLPNVISNKYLDQIEIINLCCNIYEKIFEEDGKDIYITNFKIAIQDIQYKYNPEIVEYFRYCNCVGAINCFKILLKFSKGYIIKNQLLFSIIDQIIRFSDNTTSSYIIEINTLINIDDNIPENINLFWLYNIKNPKIFLDLITVSKKYYTKFRKTLYFTFLEAIAGGNLLIIQWLLSVKPSLKNKLIKNEDSVELFRDIIITRNLNILKELMFVYDQLSESKKRKVLYTIFSEAAIRGLLDVLEWAHETFGMNIQDHKKTIIDTISFVARYGKLKILKWIVETFDVNDNHIGGMNDIIYLSALKGKNLKILQWLTDKFYINADNLECILDMAIVYLIKKGSFNVFQWFINKFNDIENIRVFKYYRHFDITEKTDAKAIKWLINKTNVSAEEFKQQSLYVLGILLEKKQINTVEWLVDRFNITIDNIRFNDNQLLRSACDLETTQWLVNKFNLTVEDIRTENNHVLQMAVYNNHLELAKWLINTFNLTSNDIKTNNYKIFHDLITNDELEFFQWLIKTVGLTINELIYNNLLESILTCSRINFLKWLISEFNISINDLRKIDELFLGNMISDYNDSVLQWLDTFDLTKNDVLIRNGFLLKRFVRDGFLKGLQWIHSKFGIAVDYIQDRNNYILRWSVYMNHMNILQWLVKNFDLTIQDAKCKNNKLLYVMIRHGNLENLQMFINTFGFTINDIVADNNYALKISAKIGYSTILKWLITNFNLTTEDIKTDNNYIFQRVDLETKKWLLFNFDFNNDDVKANNNYAIRNNDFATVQWLVETFDFTVEDIRSKNNDLLNKLLAHGNLSEIQWLVNTFGLNKSDLMDCYNIIFMIYFYEDRYVDIKDWLLSTFDIQKGTISTTDSFKLLGK